MKLLPPEITPKEKIGEYDKLLDQSYPAALAILLSHQLAKKTVMEKERKNITDIYRRQLNVPYNTYMGDNRFSLLRFPLLVKDKNKILTLFRKKNIFLGQWYCQPVAPKEIPLPRVGYGQGSCPTAETVCKRIINLPINVSSKEAKKIVKVLNDVT
jgi:dTDP-4-amino-4,6-dideoxygalactose transaminase